MKTFRVWFECKGPTQMPTTHFNRLIRIDQEKRCGYYLLSYFWNFPSTMFKVLHSPDGITNVRRSVMAVLSENPR